MKEIKLIIEDGTLRQLKSAIAVKGICGNLYGILHAFCVKVFESIDEGKTELLLEIKRKEKSL